MENYIQRGLEKAVTEAVTGFPAVMLTGPRQVGKTTLLKRLLGRTFRYVSVEPLDVRDLARRDPRGFLDLYSPPVIFDEIQHAPGLLPYLKERIDADRGANGQYVLTGSQNLLLMESVSETLAGRVAVLRLWPLAQRELAGEPSRLLPWEPTRGDRIREMSHEAYLRRVAFCETLLLGGFPDIVTGRAADRSLWFASYVQTYLERDVRNLRHVGDLVQFQCFVKALALRCAQILNISDVSKDLGISTPTARAWLGVLEASGLTMLLRPYLEHSGKRLVKSPKLYFTDTGLLCHLAGITTAEQLALSPLGGAVMETAVLMEVVKAASFAGKVPSLGFWRTSNGAEVDLVVEVGDRLAPIDTKLSATPKIAMASGIHAFRKDHGSRSLPGWVVYSGDMLLPMGDGALALPYTLL
jgi:hypothetical protein